jgi:hypothetical protein
MREASRSGSNPDNGVINTTVDEHESSTPLMANKSPSSLNEPLLNDQTEPVPSHSIDIEGDITTVAFAADLYSRVKLPKKISRGHIPKAAFAVITTAAGSFLYAMGGKMLGIKYEVGGIGINIPQNL